MKLPEFLIQQMSLGNKVKWYLMITEREMAKQNNGFKIKGSMNIWKQKGKDEGGESKLLGGRGSTSGKSSQEAKKKKKKKIVQEIKATLESRTLNPQDISPSWHLERFEFYVFGVFSQVLRYLQRLENCTYIYSSFYKSNY